MRATAEREVGEMRARAEARVRELDRSAQRIWGERRRLLESLNAVVQELQGVAEAEAGRFPGPVERAAVRSAPPGKPMAEPGVAPTSRQPSAPLERDEPPRSPRSPRE